MIKAGFSCGNLSGNLGLDWDLLSRVSLVSSALSSDADSHLLLLGAQRVWSLGGVGTLLREV